MRNSKLKNCWFLLSLAVMAAFLVLGVFLFNPFHSRSNVSKILSTLPKDDKEELEWLFRYLNFDAATSYVLFGNKPMGFALFYEIEPHFSKILDPYDFEDSFTRLSQLNVRINRGWNSWKKHRHLFPSTNFLLIENRNSKCIRIFMINKREFIKKVEENIDIFREFLGNHITPDAILNDCITSNNVIDSTLKNNDYLLGILLGFGRHNAELFFRRKQIKNEKHLKEISLTQETLTPSRGFSTLEEEYNHINKILTSFAETNNFDFNPLFMFLPGFVADHGHAETQQLKSEYTRQYKKILKTYRNGDFLETTLKQYCN